MTLTERVQTEIQELVRAIKEKQSSDGAWRYCFETGPMTDANMIIILRMLNYQEDELIKKLVNRLLNTQQTNGAWKLYDDAPGHLSATVEAYAALLFSGYAKLTDTNMKMAEAFILKNGGLKKTHASTKFMLALNTLYLWPKIFPFPLLIIHAPARSPLSFYRFSSYVRAHFAPVLILGHKRFTIENDWTPNLSHLYLRKPRKKRKRFFSVTSDLIAKLFVNPAMNKAESEMLEGVGDDGTLFGYASATFFMIYTLIALDYEPKSHQIQDAVKGLISFLYKLDNDVHIQNSPSTIWDTALISHSLQEAGCQIDDEVVSSSVNYLITIKERQNQSDSGGWGFSETSASPLDIDDTQAALRAIYRFSLHQENHLKAWHEGVHWLINMQNNDGGWGAFEKNKHQSLFTLLPIKNLKDTVIDPSTADLTGRTLEFLGNWVKMAPSHPCIKSAVNWLLKNQEKNGSWYGRWGVSYIYGTWAAVTGLRAVGVSTQHPAIQKALSWLRRIQQADGGWGESCQSDQKRTYIPLMYSTIVQTSWAVDTLMAGHDQSIREADKGITYLLNWRSHSAKTISYPTGAGLPGHFYIHYHSYKHIWPLLALSHYLKTYDPMGD